MADTAITVEGLSKLYRIGEAERRQDTFVGAMAAAAASPLRNLRRLRRLGTVAGDGDGEAGDDAIWALRDVSFEVERGEVLGIVGRNGAGKSTLLKILSRITEPTSGRACIEGRVSSLLEVGTGFHPELTGRENVYLNGTILGMTKREVDRKFDEIVDFSGVEKFLDTPVKRYSSGMKVRLAFAVAAHLEPEILIVDEVLAVGDAEFQTKCLGKMQSVATRDERTVLFVSHRMSAVEALCDRVAVMEAGQLANLGPTDEMIRLYMSGFKVDSGHRLVDRRDREGDGRGRLVDLWVGGEAGARAGQVRSGEEITINLVYEIYDNSCLPLDFTVGLYDALGVSLARLSTQYVPLPLRPFPRRGLAACVLPRVPLPAGEYFLNVAITDPRGHRVDRIEKAATFGVHGSDYFGTGKIPPPSLTKILLDHTWGLEEVEAASVPPPSVPSGVASR